MSSTIVRIDWDGLGTWPDISDARMQLLGEIREAADFCVKEQDRIGSGDTVSLHEYYKQLEREMRKRTGPFVKLPVISTFYNVFKGTPTVRGVTVRSVLEAVGVPSGTAIEFGEQLDRLSGKFPRDADSGDRSETQRQATLLLEIQNYRERWDRGLPGTDTYRRPSESLPCESPDLLTEALRMTTDSHVEILSLTEEDVAYCLFSSVVHGRDVRAWLEQAKESAKAAEAMVDLVGWTASVRAPLRAAWCLTQFQSEIQEDAVQFARSQYSDAESELHELIDAIARDQIEEHLDSLVLTNAFGEDTWKARAVADEIRRPPLKRAARGALSAAGQPGTQDLEVAEVSRLRALATAIQSSRDRFERRVSQGGGYKYFKGEHFANTARAALPQLDRLSDSDRVFLLRGAIFVQCGEGFGIFDFLPKKTTDRWPLPLLGYYLEQGDYRTPRYHSAIILQHLEFANRAEFVRSHLSKSSYRKVDELCEAIENGTMQQYFMQPELCYDFQVDEAQKLRNLRDCATDIRTEFA